MSDSLYAINGDATGGGGGGASIPVTTMAALLAGATPSRIAATDSGGTGALLTAAQAQSALGLVASPDLTTGTVVDTGASVGTATATAYTVALASGAVVNDGSKITVPWPVVDTNMTMTGRFVTTGVAAGNRAVYVVVTFGGAAAGNVVRIDVDDLGNVTLKINGAFIVGHVGPATPRTTTWFRVRVDASTLTVWDSSSGVFASPFYTAVQGFLVASGASTYATITSIALTVAQVTTTSDAPTTVVIDNITLRPTA